MKQNRYTNLDILRILACFMVIVIHTASMRFYIPVKSSAWAVFNFSSAAMRSSVPLFLMISGMLVMSKEEYSIKKLLLKSIPRLLLIFLLWSTFYAIDIFLTNGMIHNFNLKVLLQTIFNLDDNAVHLWYLPMFIGVCFLSPVLHTLRDQKKILMYSTGMFLIFSILWCTLVAFPGMTGAVKILAQFENAFSSYAGYFLIGYLLYYYQDKIRISNMFLLIALVTIITLTGITVQWLSITTGVQQIGLYNNLALPTFLEACIIFILFLRVPSEKIDIKWNRSGWVNKLAKYTLFVYVFHPFVLKHLESDFNITTTSANALLTMPLISVGVFVLCLVVAFVIDQIPGVRKILL